MRGTSTEFEARYQVGHSISKGKHLADIFWSVNNIQPHPGQYDLTVYLSHWALWGFVPLFNAKVLQRASSGIQTIPDAHSTLLSRWAGMVRDGTIRLHKETALDGDFKKDIVESILGYRPAGHGDGQTVDAEHAIGSGRVDLALGYFGESSTVIAPFELKGATTRDLDAPMPGRNISPVDQAWGYARTVGRSIRWVLVSNYVEIRLYSYRDGTLEYERFELSRIDELEEYQRFVTLLSAEKLLGGRTLELLHESLEADKEIGDAFYAEYQELREALIGEIAADPAEHSPERVIALAQTIMDRVLFIAFAEDRQLLPRNLLSQTTDARNAFDPHPVWDNFKGLFCLIDEGGEVEIEGQRHTINAYNGGLFRRDPEIQHLALSDEACGGFKSLGGYDFAEDVDVPILGHIFEQSLRDLEKHLAIARGEEDGDYRTLGKSKSRRKQDGIYYTPEFVARFITQRTLGAAMNELFRAAMLDHAEGDSNKYEALRFRVGERSYKAGSPTARSSELASWYDYRSRLQKLRVVDPACGSGIFLVTAFDSLKREFDRTNAKIAELRGDAGTIDMFDIDAEILRGNLYGVDVNAESVEITKLSLWLKTAKRDRPLDALDHTIRVGDSLIENSNYAYLQHGFTWEGAFPEVFDSETDEAGFDVVLGNPPYVRMERIKPMKPFLETRYEVVADRADLYCYFYERGLRLLKPDGRLGFISSVTFFKARYGKALRNYLRTKATIECAIDFYDEQIFEGVTTSPVILTMRTGEPSNDHAIRYWDVLELPSEEFGAAFDDRASYYPQAALNSGSWQLESEELRKLRSKIVANHPTLEDVYGQPVYGIKTGRNEAFVIDQAKRDELVASDPGSERIVKRLLVGDDCERWRVEWCDQYLIYIPKNSITIDDYPAVRDHLASYREQLEGRATQQAWFELQQPQEAHQATYENCKIVYPEMSQGAKFSIDDTGYYPNNKCFCIPSNNHALLAFLNSRPIWFFLAGQASALRGGEWRLELRHEYMRRIPIPADLESDQTLVGLGHRNQSAAGERLSLQRGVFRRLPDLCPSERREFRRLREAWA